MQKLLAPSLVITLLCCGGCQKALFPKDAPRTQYETYDRMRATAPPLTEPDVFGNPQPALRARLSPSR
jgi:hypothetical protein